MRSKLIDYKGHKIFFQDFSGHSLIETDLVKEELKEVQAFVMQQPPDSLLVLADFSETQIGKDLMDILKDSSKITKGHVKKTAVLGVTGLKRILADMLMHVTGQAISVFEDEDRAKEWLIQP